MNTRKILSTGKIIINSSILIIMLGSVITPGAARNLDNTSSLTTLIEMIDINPNTLDPALAYDAASSHIIYQIYDTLLFYNREKTDEFIPMLATDWEISLDGLTYTFDIRPDVQFHNGNSLTASDVAYTFQRGILQGGANSPQWLLTQPFFGTSITDVTMLVDGSGSLVNDRTALQAWTPASDLVAACQQVTDAIVADDIAGTVTFTLAQKWPPFLTTLIHSVGAIMDKQWLIANGGWDGSCSTWQNKYYAEPESDVFTAMTNGTGPFELDYWHAGDEINLLRNNNYWRGVSQPMWDGVPGGPAFFEQVIIQMGHDDGDRFDALLDGTADMAFNLGHSYFTDLDSQVVYRYTQADGLNPTIENPYGILKRYDNATPQSTDAFFNYQFNTGGSYDYDGSGTLDGDGIPVDFFSDEHIRKAFSYAFNYDQFLTDVFGSDMTRRRGPIPSGVMGYSASSWIYPYDPVKAEDEMESADTWGAGEVAAKGFIMTMPYISDNDLHLAFANRIKSDIEALNSNYHVNLLELSYADYRDDRYDRFIPLFIRGWLADIAHPHNWVSPYMTELFAIIQQIPSATRTTYQGMINTCAVLSGSAAETCYAGLQSKAISDAIDIFLAQPTARYYLRAPVQGYYVNAYEFGAYFYALSKGAYQFHHLPIIIN